MSITHLSTGSIFYKLPTEFIRRHGYSSNTNHMIYKEINDKPELQRFIRQRINYLVMDIYRITQEQHVKRHKDMSLIQDMFPTELVNPEKFKQEQEHKQWNQEQTRRLDEWKEQQAIKAAAAAAATLDKDADKDAEDKENNRLVISKKRPDRKTLTVEVPVADKTEKKTRIYKITSSKPN